jgi:predicted lipoprotein with Yx(FWY)xxD motif
MRTRYLTRHTFSLAALVGATAIVLAACSGTTGSGTTGGGYTDSGGGASAQASAPGSGDTVSAKDIGGRSVLVSASGNPVYASDQERASGSVLCVSSGCLAFWKPVTVASGTATGTVDGQALGEITRPDGAKQVSLGGVPLYTFASDSTGQIKGDGLSDTFDGQTLTWHVVASDGSPAGSGAASPSTGGTPGY